MLTSRLLRRAVPRLSQCSGWVYMGRSSFHTTALVASQPSSSTASIPPPLAGLRIVDLTRVLAGPYCTMLLADLGADVIKVEHPKGGDDTRSWSPPSAPHLPTSELSAKEMTSLKLTPEKKKYWDSLPAESAYFLSVNRNKRSITVDLKKQEGRDIVRELIKSADVVVENYLPGKLSTMQLGYEDAKKLNPVSCMASRSKILMCPVYRLCVYYWVWPNGSACYSGRV